VGSTPLHIAAQWKSIEVAKVRRNWRRTCVLNEHRIIGVDTDSSRRRWKEWHWTYSLTRCCSIQLSWRGEGPIFPCHFCKRLQCQELIANGADIKAESNAGFSPLHVASYNGALPTVRVCCRSPNDLYWVPNAVAIVRWERKGWLCGQQWTLCSVLGGYSWPHSGHSRKDCSELYDTSKSFVLGSTYQRSFENVD